MTTLKRFTLHGAGTESATIWFDPNDESEEGR
jgi:hypothetical protein